MEVHIYVDSAGTLVLKKERVEIPELTYLGSVFLSMQTSNGDELLSPGQDELNA